MKKTLIATITVVVLAHIILFGVLAIRGGEVNGEPSPQEATEQSTYDEPRTESPAPLEPPADARELLDGYAVTQDKIRSYAMRIRTTTKATFQISAERPGGLLPSLNGEWECGYSSEFASDGERYSLRSEGWGYTAYGSTELPDKKSYQSHLWDGRDFYSFSKTKTKLKGRQDGLFLSRGETSRDFGSVVGMYQAGGELFGYLWLDYVRADAIVGSGESLHLRPEMEAVAGTLCYVVEADTKAGRYTLWFDPGHGYQLAGAEVVRRPGDIRLFLGLPVPEGMELRASFRVTRFERVDGTWVPMVADAEDVTFFPPFPSDGGVIRRHMERTAVTLNPDHEKRRSFYPDDVTEGADVTIITDRERSGGLGGGHVWRNGRPMPVQK